MIRFISPANLHKLGIVGMNARNRAFIMKNNPRRLYPFVDDKLETKKLARKHNIAIPPLYGVIETVGQIKKRLYKILDQYDEFVIKPSKGSGGNGILVIIGRTPNGYIKANGEEVSCKDIFLHVSNILSGLYSLGGQLDKAMIEYRVKFSDVFSEVSYQGVPDVRVIVYKGYPVMGMLRLATKESDGKANLHQGAIGAGVKIADGLTLGGVRHNKVMNIHPDTGKSISGIRIAAWTQILHTSSKCYEMTKMGYIGVDIVLDKALGPLILELNARPGLGIQIANREGLRKRLDKIDRVADPEMAFKERAHWSMENF